MRADDSGKPLTEMKRPSVAINFDAVRHPSGDVAAVRNEDRLFEGVARHRLVEHVKCGLAERGGQLLFDKAARRAAQKHNKNGRIRQGNPTGLLGPRGRAPLRLLHPNLV